MSEPNPSPYDLGQQRKETREMLDDLTTRDQRMMFAVVTLVHLADSKEELAVLMPFKAQEIWDRGGVYYGQNAAQKAVKVKTKETHIGAQTETQVTVAANPQRQGQRVFVEERGRRAARWQAEQRRAISRRQIKTAQVLHSDRDGRSIPDRMRSEQIPHIKKRAETSLPKPARKKHLPMERDIVSVSPHSRKMADTAKTLESAQKQAVMLKSSARAAREATMQTARYQQAAKAAQVTAQKASQAAGRALRAILSTARSLAAAMMAGGSTVLSMVPAVYAVRTTTDTSSPDEVATLREEKLDILRQIFWDMNEVSYEQNSDHFAAVLHSVAADCDANDPSPCHVAHLENLAGVNINDYLLALRQVPEPILTQFRQEGWTYTIDYDYLAELGKKRGISCVGCTNYSSRRIYVSEAAATLHEFGHFLDGQLGFPAEHERLYLAEAQNSGLRNYAKTNTREYFADFFVGHPERQNKQGRRNDLLRLCLRCKKMDMEVVLLVNR